VAAWRDDDGCALRLDLLAQAVGVLGLVRENLFCLQPVDQIIGWCHVVLLSGAKVEADRQAQRIDYRMDFGAEPAARPAKSLGFLAPLFSGAPAACA
jgi:hypothetical protein